jgi:mannose-1-phosphate guanylyltransferase
MIFRDTVSAAFAHAAGSEDLVTIGMRPTRPETAFGYLELGEALKVISSESGEIDDFARSAIHGEARPDSRRVVPGFRTAICGTAGCFSGG